MNDEKFPWETYWNPNIGVTTREQLEKDLNRLSDPELLPVPARERNRWSKEYDRVLERILDALPLDELIETAIWDEAHEEYEQRERRSS